MSYVSIYESKMVSLSKFVSSVSMLLIILVALQFKNGKSGLFLKDRVHMSITNNSTNGLQLGVHCRDKHNDIGFRSIHFGETYSFTFRPGTLLKNTLYYCDFTWSNSAQNRHFDVYDEHRDDATVKKECHWEINQSGPCRFNYWIGPNTTECFHWP